TCMYSAIPFSETFQSTHLMRGATKGANALMWLVDISIHAPHARCDSKWSRSLSCVLSFQSTHLMRGATLQRLASDLALSISIHAPHARCDSKFAQKLA